jgi:hypothetical protein
MISANKLYRESKSELSFKQWLKNTQNKGILQDHEKMYNMIESDDTDYSYEDDEQDSTDLQQYSKKSTTSQDSKSKLGMVNILGLIGIGLLIYGLSRTKAE